MHNARNRRSLFSERDEVGIVRESGAGRKVCCGGMVGRSVVADGEEERMAFVGWMGVGGILALLLLGFGRESCS